MSTCLFFGGQIPCVDRWAWRYVAVTQTNRHQAYRGHFRILRPNSSILQRQNRVFTTFEVNIPCVHSWTEFNEINSHIFQVTRSPLYQERNSMEQPLVNLANLKISQNLQRVLSGNGTYPAILTLESLNGEQYKSTPCSDNPNSWLGRLQRQQVSKSPEARCRLVVPHHGFLFELCGMMIPDTKQAMFSSCRFYCPFLNNFIPIPHTFA